MMEDIRFTMRKDHKHELVSYAGYSRQFLRWYEDIEIAIGRLKTRYPILMVKH